MVELLFCEGSGGVVKYILAEDEDTLKSFGTPRYNNEFEVYYIPATEEAVTFFILSLRDTNAFLGVIPSPECMYVLGKGWFWSSYSAKVFDTW